MVNVLVVAEHYQGALKRVTLNVLSAAKKIIDAQGGGEIHFAVLGQGVGKVAEDLKPFGAAKIWLAEHDALAKYLAVPYASTVAAIAKKANANYVLGPSTAFGKDLMPVVAAKLEAGMASDIRDVKGNSFVRAVYAGNAMVNVEITTPLKVCSVLGTSFPVAAPGGGASPIENFAASPEPGKVRYLKMDEVKSTRPELTEARIVVSGGRGFKGPENTPLIEKLADKLHAAIGWTRAAIDAGWAPNDLQVGQTGKIVAPDLYLAIGISGAIQHLAGMKSSKVIVAINKDPEAPIFSVADYGLVADLFKALPELTEKISLGG